MEQRYRAEHIAKLIVLADDKNGTDGPLIDFRPGMGPEKEF